MKKLFLLLAAICTFAVTVCAQTITIKGTVVSDEDNEPLSGATVQPIGGGTGVAANIDGEFTLTVPSSVKQLKVSFIGYDTKTVAVAPVMTIKLKSKNVLETVVVTGYGSAKKLGSVVGSVAVVNADAINNTPATNFVDALQGQVAGLSILSASGDPSSLENDIRIRGINSLNSSTTPLFILDGAPVSASVFNTLNPSDIESITVLKDAASTSIYGTRAANGVIVITSKKGKFGENGSVTIRAGYGWSSPVQDNVDMMDSKQYAKYRNLIGQPLDAAANHAVYDLGINTDWVKEIFSNYAPTWSLDGSVTGGSQNISYYIGLSHYEQEGIIAQSGMRREVLRANLDARVNDWFRIGLQTNLGYSKFQTNNESGATYSGSGLYATNPMIFARKAMPFDSPRYYTEDANGKINWLGKAKYLHFSGLPTPSYIEDGRSVWRNRLTINATLTEQLNPVKGLTIRATQAVDAYDSRLKNLGFSRGRLYTPMGDVYDNGLRPSETATDGYNQQSFSRYYQFTYNETAEYQHTFSDKHNMTVLLGTESIITRSESFGLFTSGYPNRDMMLLGQNTLPTDANNLSQSMGTSVMNSLFVTLDYDFDSRYSFYGSYRRDGSSKFPSKHRWGNFFSLGGMWNAKNESFLKDVDWLSDLKVRLSYGTTGNSGISDYLFYGLVETSSVTYNGGSILGVASQSIEDLTWEKLSGWDLGVNFGFFNNRLTGEIDFYNKVTSDMLLAIPYSFTTGYSSGYGNIGDMLNRGVDITLNGTVFQNRDWYVGLRFNLNYNHNEITKLFQGRDHYTLQGTGLRYQVGWNAGSYYMVRFAGVDPRDGAQMWYTKEGNLTKEFNEERDAVMLKKSAYAPISGGFGLNASWKGLSLSADFTWAARKYMTNNDRYFMENNNFGTDFNQMTSMLDVWTHPGQKTNIPRVGQELQFDTHLLEDASFMRMKNITVRYAFPRTWMQKIKLQNLALHFTGRNLWTVTDYTGYDPEPESNVVTFFYPNTRQYEFGLEVTF